MLFVLIVVYLFCGKKENLNKYSVKKNDRLKTQNAPTSVRLRVTYCMKLPQLESKIFDYVLQFFLTAAVWINWSWNWKNQWNAANSNTFYVKPLCV